MRLPIVAALLLLSPAAGLHLLGTPKQPQRGHRVSPEYCEDLPRSWAKEAKLAQLDGRVPTAHGHLLVATFACGCYWGPELAFQRTPGVVATCVGHTGYESGGANEAVQLVYDPSEVAFSALCDVLWSRIDPTLKNQVGLDRGAIYRHCIYVHTAEQEAVAQSSLAARRELLAPATVHTQVAPAELFYVAEPRHQRYLERGMKGTPQSAAKGCTDPIACYGGVSPNK
jgi:peptide-methionine (S)-S-oxide reductase